MSLRGGSFAAAVVPLPRRAGLGSRPRGAGGGAGRAPAGLPRSVPRQRETKAPVYRLHHPEQLRNLGHYVDMFPVEASHQRYKGSTADHYAHLVNRAGGALSTGVLWRYLQDALLAAEGPPVDPDNTSWRLEPPLMAEGVGAAHGYPRVLRRDSRRVLTPRGWAADTASGRPPARR